LLTVDNITIKFGGLTAVDAVNFSIKDNSVFGLIGPNGAGKTTLFNIISGLRIPSGGSVYLDNENITGLPPYKICRKGIARTYQNINLFQKLTVKENVMIGRHRMYRTGLWGNIIHTKAQQKEENKNIDKSMELLAFMGLENKKNYLAKNLSYGEQRRLEIARAMASEPQILLLDEPAAGMNTKEKLDLMEILKRINNLGITILLVEHDMKLVMNITDEICVLNFGKKIAQGTPEQIQHNPDVIEAYLGGCQNGK